MKRLFDLAIASAALAMLSPVFGGVACLVRVNLGSPVLFRQRRGGLNGRPFDVIKFRTMRDQLDNSGQMLPDAERLTPLGRFLRASSLDELPGLVNVLKGEMSLVGPRPLIADYLPLYTPAQARRHAVRPGITGWAQINGRNALSWEDKFEMDTWYVDNQSLMLDLKILVLTIAKVIRSEGVSAAGEATMPRFLGSLPTPAEEAPPAQSLHRTGQPS